MPEKEMQFGERGLSLEQWAEGKALDFIIQNTRAKPLKMEDFVGHYGQDTIDEDKAVAEALKEKFNDELRALSAPERERRQLSQKRGKVLEIIIAEQGELNEWFGPDAMTARTAEVDDFRGKVDLVIEFIPEEREQPTEQDIERIAFAVDASDDPSRIGEKMRINLERLTGKRPPAHVRYFRSQGTDYVGPIDKIIPVVVGLEAKNMQDLVRLQHEALRKSASPKTVDEANKQLAKHPAQRVFIEQILEQLRWYARLLEQKKETHSRYGKEDIDGLLKIMEDLLKEKRSIRLGELEEDMIRQEIQKMIK